MIWHSCHTEGISPTLDECVAFVDGVVNTPDAACFVASDRWGHIGALIIRRLPENAQPIYEVNHLYVLPSYRGALGVAQALIKAACDWASAFNDEATVIITTKGEPRPYYKALGFEPTHRLCVAPLSKVRERLGG